MKKDDTLLIRLPKSLKQDFRDKCTKECLNMNEYLNKLIEKEIDKMLIISNWKDYVLETVDVENLESELKYNWLDENGNLVLIDEIGEDYTKKFWERYDVAFDDKILDLK